MRKSAVAPKRKEVPVANDVALEKATEVWIAAAKARARYALDAYHEQDDRTKEALSRIRDVLMANAGGLVRIPVPGRMPVAVQIESEHIENNALYMAVEIMKDLAFMGIRVADFTFPQSYCASCGAELLSKNENRERVAHGKKARRRA